ncbi:MAG: hypothetical protein D3924_19390 [Candidatus Electrothrix sp. AR4]|nr:hypothetical protein [Candidatus Electrothrix sp. AR4]
MYAILLGSTAYITFFDNNGFASNEQNMEKLDMIETPEQLVLFEELLAMETSSMGSVNSLATQSFNVVLGALLGFLSATVTMLTGSEPSDQKSREETS